MGNLFTVLFVQPIENILIIIYQTLSFLHIPYSFGFSIILLTILLRLILYPFTAAQLKTSKKMQELTPHLSRIKKKHKNDAKMLQQETMRLYKEFGVNPAAGCLPMLVQLPFIWAIYSVFQKLVSFKQGMAVSEINKIIYFDVLKLKQLWDPTFFGIPLGQNPSHLISAVGPIILLIPVLTGLFQLVQSKMMMASKAKEVEEMEDKKSSLAKSGDGKEDDFSSAFQAQSLYIFPLMIGFFSYTLPFGLSLYWNTFTIFGILQQYKIQGLGGLREWKEKLEPFFKK